MQTPGFLLLLCDTGCYISVSAFSDFRRKADLFLYELMKYFICELNGHDPLNPCDRSVIEGIQPDGLSIMVYMNGGILPVVNLIFVISIQDSKRRLKFLCNKIKTFCTSNAKNTAVDEIITVTDFNQSVIINSTVLNFKKAKEQ